MKRGPYIREGTFPVDYVLNLIREARCAGNRTIKVNGYSVHTDSERYTVFLEKGTTCVGCGLKALYFALERNRHEKNPVGQNVFHFNLYALTSEGEVLFTKDHIMPRSSGGVNFMHNYQTMCAKCNVKKDDRLPPKDVRQYLCSRRG